MTLPKLLMEMLADLPPLEERVDAAGRVDAVSACQRLGVDGQTLAAFVRRGELVPVRADDGGYWFEPAELEVVRPHAVRPRGRPAIGEVVETRLPPALLGRIDELACGEDVSRAEMVRRLLVEAVAARQQP